VPTNYSSGVYIPPSPVEWVTKYVDGGPFTRFATVFTVENAVIAGVLCVEVLTIYEDFARSAVVLLNNQQVGKIDPRPTSRYGDLQPYSVFFRVDTALIDRRAQPRALVRTGYQFVEIAPVRPPNQPADFTDSLIVGKWHVMYWQSLIH
jgi:hypothetical protein